MGKNSQDDGTFHGGFLRSRGQDRGVRTSTPKITELAVPDAEEARARSEELQANKRPGSFPKGHSPLKERRTKLACLGIPSFILDQGDPAYARCIRLANAYKKARTRELYIAHGFISSGVSALLAASSLALAGSRFLYEIAASTDVNPESGLGLPQLLKIASSLSDSARQNETSAWELACRESVIHKRNANNNQQVPWMIQTETGKEVLRAGRPRKAMVALTGGGQGSGGLDAWNNGQIEVGRSISESVQAGQVAGQPSGGQNESGGSGQGGDPEDSSGGRP